MKKNVVFTVSATLAALLAASLLFADDPNEVRVVYPSSAAQVELDDSTPAKRAEPPARESNELDPVTPLGQIRAVLESLSRLESSQEEIRTELRKTTNTLDDDAIVAKLGAKLPTRERFDALFPALEKNSEDVDALLKTTTGIAAKLDALQQTTENLRATVEAAQATAESIERIRTSKWTDYAVLAILALVLIQLLCRFATFFVNRVKTTRSRIEELVEAYTITKQQLAEAKAKTKVKTTKK